MIEGKHLQTFFEANFEKLNKAIKDTPIYMNYPNCQPSEDKVSWFNSLPLLDKTQIIEKFPFNFFSEDSDAIFDPSQNEIVESSGTSEHKIQVIRPLDFKKIWTSAAHRYHKVYESPDVKEAILTTLNCSRSQCNLPFSDYEERIQGHRLLLNRSISPVHWNDEECQRMLDELVRFKPTVLTAHPLYFIHFDRWLQRNGKSAPHVPVIFFSYDFVSDICIDRAKHWDADDISVQYGLTEVFTAFTRCSQGHYHLIEEGLYAEVLNDGQPTLPGEVGELVLTSVRNPLMPLVRYRTGDLVKVSNQGLCSCDFSSFHIESLEGRQRERIVGKEEALSLRTLDRLLSQYPEVDYYQLDQTDNSRPKLLLVCPSDEKESLPEIIDAKVSALIGLPVEVLVVREIPMQRNGKYAYVIGQAVDTLAPPAEIAMQ
ncbi:phenylacetate--CoA ligase family protein [Enterovibrio coralii]|uniref:CoF synthetase n=1 Tax=Enterovibrio coralii TaxID=294935 RepID=A0A135I541_9GAMM|nr:phenylacetate--CoA ligase family protein [Enterovibrio coralii]KXF80534.1 hypothetical protein ATN88_07560 [Enterovibrio coralii]